MCSVCRTESGGASALADLLTFCRFGLAAALFCAAAVCVAEPARFYGSVGLGWSYAEPFVIDDTNGVIDYDFNPSVWSIAAGVNVARDWRVELEASLQDNAPEVWYFRGSAVELDTKSLDDLRAASYLVNAYRDFHFGEAVRPYVGLGLGAARVRLRFIEYEPFTGYENPLIDDHSWTFAYQAIAGLTVPLARRFGLGVEYRYWRAPDLKLQAIDGSVLEGNQAIHSGWLRLNYQPGGYPWPSAPDPAAVAGPGFQVSGTLGVSWGPDRDFKYIPGQFDAFDIGPLLAFAAGYQFAGHWRLMVDVARRRNEMEIYDTRIEETRTKGKVVGDSLTFNVDYRFRPHRAIDPFVSLGLGAARIRYEVNTAAGRSPMIHDTVTPVVIQWQLGVDLALSNRWTVSTDYRGMFSDHFTLAREDGDSLTTTYLMHSMSISVRYRL